jgi:hypothetical protein
LDEAEKGILPFSHGRRTGLAWQNVKPEFDAWVEGSWFQSWDVLRTKEVPYEQRQGRI